MNLIYFKRLYVQSFRCWQKSRDEWGLMNSFVQSGPPFNTTFDFRVWPAVFYCRELMKTFYSFYRFYIISEHARFLFRYPFLAPCQPRFRQKHNVCFCNIWLRIGHVNGSQYDDFSWDRQYEYFFHKFTTYRVQRIKRQRRVCVLNILIIYLIIISAFQFSPIKN